MISIYKLLFLSRVVFPPDYKKTHNDHLVVLDKDQFYYEKPLHFLSVPDLVFYYGDRKNWWGDADAHTTRTLYHDLLPIYCPYYTSVYKIDDLAFKAYQTRKAVKQYARRRSYLHVRVFSILLDVVRNLLKYKKWRPVGATYKELWRKYEKQVQKQNPHLQPELLETKVASMIVCKSCHTNQWVDYIANKKF